MMGERGRAKSGCVGLGEPGPIARPILPFLRLHAKPPANLSRGIARYCLLLTRVYAGANSQAARPTLFLPVDRLRSNFATSCRFAARLRRAECRNAPGSGRR